jgi:hypothetical protein
MRILLAHRAQAIAAPESAAGARSGTWLAVHKAEHDLKLLEDLAMTSSRCHIEHLVLQIETDFLDNPRLALTLPAAQKRFGIDEDTCAGVLGALVDAHVLTQHERAYRRYFPRVAAAA